jgi:superfamily II DNA or RNA helicase
VCFLSGDTPIEERQRKVAAYKAGKIQHLLNCALFLEGFDAPATSAIVMCRPTKSLGLYMQVLGRGTRPLAGVVEGLSGGGDRKNAIALSQKQDMLVIDFAGNAGRHKIVQATDVLGGKYDLPVREYAKNNSEAEGGAGNIEDALERARLELALEEEESARRRHILATAKYSTEIVDPFVRRYGQAKGKVHQAEVCSDKQAWKIYYLSRKSWSFEQAKTLSKRAAGAVIDKLLKKVKA